jgi:hypothetical protein
MTIAQRSPCRSPNDLPPTLVLAPIGRTVVFPMDPTHAELRAGEVLAAPGTSVTHQQMNCE